MNLLFAPGTQEHHDYLVEHKLRVLAGEIPPPVTTPEQVAEHEAAHAFVADALHVPFGVVVLVPVDQWQRGESAGWSTASITGPNPEDVLIRGCAVLWAGAIADGHLLNSQHDLDLVVQASLHLPEPKRGIPFFVAADLVTRYRPAIKAVAARLMQTGRLTRAEVVQILREATNPN